MPVSQLRDHVKHRHNAKDSCRRGASVGFAEGGPLEPAIASRSISLYNVGGRTKPVELLPPIFRLGCMACRLLLSNDSVVKPVMCQSGMAFNSGVAERRVFIPPEREHSLIHLLSIEHLQLH
jgi:hypothetical protein